MTNQNKTPAESSAPALSVVAGSVFPTLATHRARQNRDGLSRWKIRTSKGERTIQLQAYKGRLYLYGQMIERERNGVPMIRLRFEETLAGITQVFGKPYSPNNSGLPGRASDLGSDRGLGVLPKTKKPPQAKS